MKKIFLDNLPKKIHCKKECIDWMNSIGYKVRFIYDDIEGEIEINDHIKYKQRLKIKYNNKIFDIRIDHFIKCCIGKILGVRTKEFKIEIGQTFKDDKRNLTIIDREYRKNKKGQTWKYYKYHCNNCGAELWIEEHSLLKRHNGCSCCSNTATVKGINDIATTNPEMIKYFVNEEDTHKYSKGSNKKVLCKCPNCGYEKTIKIADIKHNGFSCPKCGDGISYPEKVMYNLLQQLNINFITQYSKTNASWCNKYRYDFYFKYNNEEYIVETHGEQHYKTPKGKWKITLKEQQNIDRNKKELAIKNGIKPENYIVIDCRYSELEYIKNNIINSRFCEIFDLNEVDWIKIGQDSEKSLVKEVCEYWIIHNNINNEGLFTTDLAKIFKLNRTTISKYLKIGSKLEWCNYNPKEEYKKGIMKNCKEKQIALFVNDKILIFTNSYDLERKSLELLNIKLYSTHIRSVCQGKRKSHKGYKFKYYDDLNDEEKNKIIYVK